MVVPFKFPRRPNIFPKRLHTLSRQFETNPFASTAMEAAGALGMSAKTLERSTVTITATSRRTLRRSNCRVSVPFPCQAAEAIG